MDLACIARDGSLLCTFEAAGGDIAVGQSRAAADRSRGRVLCEAAGGDFAPFAMAPTNFAKPCLPSGSRERASACLEGSSLRPPSTSSLPALPHLRSACCVSICGGQRHHCGGLLGQRHHCGGLLGHALAEPLGPSAASLR